MRSTISHRQLNIEQCENLIAKVQEFGIGSLSRYELQAYSDYVTSRQNSFITEARSKAKAKSNFISKARADLPNLMQRFKPPKELTEAEREDLAKKETERQKQERQQQLYKAWRRTGVPRRYADVAKMDYEEYESDISKGMGLYLHGPKGVGKTHLACGYLKTYVSRHTPSHKDYCSARFINVTAWLDDIQHTYDVGSDSEEAFQLAASPKLLVLDDLGKASGRMSAWTVGKLYRLIDERYCDQLPTIYTTQYALSSLAIRLTVDGDKDTAEAIVSRIAETTKQIPMNGKDRRMVWAATE